MARVSQFGLVVAAMMIIGCQSQRSFTDAPSPLELGATADFVVPPKELLAAVETAVQQPPISLQVAAKTRDSITTDWQRFRGDFHIARYWQERTRYRIIVIPDSEEPTARCRLQVDEETQQRAASQQEFENAGYLHRPERARELLNKLKEKLPQHSVGNVTGGNATAGNAPAADVPAAKVEVDTTWRKMIPDLGEDSPEVMTVYSGRATQLMVRTEKSIHLPPHTSPSSIVITVIRGNVRMKIGEDTSELSAGKFVVIASNTPHEAWFSADSEVSIVSDGRWDVRWVNGAPTRQDVR